MKKFFLILMLILSASLTAAYSGNSISFIKKGNGSAIIFLPGLGCKGSIWDSAVDKLSSNHSCYEISINGFAGTPLKGKFSLERISKDVMKLIRKKNLKKPVLIGHSLGGFLALKTASENPGVFSKLIIVDSFPFALSSFNPSVTAAQAQKQGKILKNMIMKESKKEYKVSEYAVLKNLIADSTNINKVLNWMAASDRRAIAEAYYEIISTDLRNKISKIRCRTLLLGTWRGKEKMGINQKTIERIFKEQYKNLKHKTIAISDNSKHFIMLDSPVWLNKQITGFISE